MQRYQHPLRDGEQLAPNRIWVVRKLDVLLEYFRFLRLLNLKSTNCPQ